MKKNYTISISIRRFWTTYLPAFLLITAIGALTGMYLVDKVLMPKIVGVTNKGETTVPALSGLSFEQAREKLYGVGLRTQISQSQYDDKVPNGYIIDQVPQTGDMVKKNRLVNVVVSKGREADTIPSLDKMTELQARNALRKKGFGRISIERIFDEEADKDNVVRLSPVPGTIISREIPVTVFMSKGPRPTTAVVPSVIGDMLSEARLKIGDAGLTIGTIGYLNRTSSQPGTVITQSETPGKSVSLESRIDLTIAANR
jgi:beta-lactam-binding protein with PASTA domain